MDESRIRRRYTRVNLFTAVLIPKPKRIFKKRYNNERKVLKGLGYKLVKVFE